MPENEEFATSEQQNYLLKLEKENKSLVELLREAIIENEKLREKIAFYEQPFLEYNESWTWIKKIVFVVRKSEKPLLAAEILAILRQKDSLLAVNSNPVKFISVMLTEAKRKRCLIPVKGVAVRGKYYCLPEWMDENGNLVLEMSKKISWYVS